MKKYERIKTLYINTELHHELKTRVVEVRKTIKELAEATLRLYLDGGPAKGGRR